MKQPTFWIILSVGVTLLIVLGYNIMKKNKMLTDTLNTFDGRRGYDANGNEVSISPYLKDGN